MILELDDGRKIRVGKKSKFEITLENGLRSLKVSSTGKGKYRHIGWFYGKPSAEKKKAEIEEAIKSGEKVFYV